MVHPSTASTSQQFFLTWAAG